jgi:hypothetical protein
MRLVVLTKLFRLEFEKVYSSGKVRIYFLGSVLGQAGFLTVAPTCECD